MSAPQKPRGRERDAAEEAAGRRRGLRPKRSPCGNPPATPTNLFGEFDRAEGGRGNAALRAKLRWDEVIKDTAGHSSRVDVYKLEVEYSADQVNWFLKNRYSIPAKDDTDPNEKVHKVIKGLHRKLWYRFRVLAVDVDGCKSAWSSDYVIGNPGPDEPPAPSNVRIFDRSVDRIVMPFALADDPDDSEEIHPDIDHCGAEISLSPNFSSIYDRDRHFKGERISFRIPKADRKQVFYGRLWTVDEDGRRSAKIPAWDPDLHGGVGNSDPFAQADGVRISPGKREIKVFTIPGAAQVKRYPQRWTADQDYDLVKIRMTVGDHEPADHPASDGTPGGSPLKANLVWTSADLSTKENILPSDERLRVEPDTHKDVAAVGSQEFNRTSFPEDSHLNPKIVAIGSSRPGSDVEIQVVAEPK